MEHYSDAELEGLIEQGESDHVEFKESWGGDTPTKARKAICAFANDLPGNRKPGVLFVGLRDDATPSGLPITDDLLLTLRDIKTDGRIVPPPTITVQKRRLKQADIAVVIVEPSDTPPVRFEGRIWVRVGPSQNIATAQDERVLNERRRARDIPYDAQPIPSAGLEDLDGLLFERQYLPRAFAPDILDANDRTLEQRLASCKMISSIDNPIPTICGMLTLGIRTRDFIPGAYIQFLKINGVSLSEPIVDEDLIDGTVSDILRRIDEKLKAHVMTEVDITGSSRETRISKYPLPALQQLVRNAVMHRTYENTNAPVHVYWFSDRIEIRNPGGPFGLVNESNFGKSGIVDYRNPNIAEALRVLGYVQRFGAGIQIARNALRENGNPELEFDVKQNIIECIVRSA